MPDIELVQEAPRHFVGIRRSVHHTQLPDYFSERPKPCMGGWGRLAMGVDPTGLTLPCHDASQLPDLERRPYL